MGVRGDLHLDNVSDLLVYVFGKREQRENMYSSNTSIGITLSFIKYKL